MNDIKKCTASLADHYSQQAKVAETALSENMDPSKEEFLQTQLAVANDHAEFFAGVLKSLQPES